MDVTNMRDAVNTYISRFKSDILSKNFAEPATQKYIQDYPGIVIHTKKKRARNIIADDERCHAHKACGDRCTRKKKEGEHVCGTHQKGTPHGIMNGTTSTKVSKKVDVWTQAMCGVIYYIDANKNVYSSADIMKNLPNPGIIATYEIDPQGEYTINHF